MWLHPRATNREETPVLLLGGSGTAKTSTAYMFFDSLDGEKYN